MICQLSHLGDLDTVGIVDVNKTLKTGNLH